MKRWSLLLLNVLLMAGCNSQKQTHMVNDKHELMFYTRMDQMERPVITIQAIDVEADAFGLANVVVNGDRLDILTDTIISREVEEGLLSVSATYIGKQAVQIDPVFLSQGDSVLLLLKMIDLSEPIVNDFNREELRKQLKERIDTSKK